jgi:NDP-sugar pyrophosphorylase family protein
LIAVLLCAGYGTRMEPATLETAKALLPVAGRPLLEFTVERIVELAKIAALHVVTNHRDHAQFETWAQAARERLRSRRIELTLHDDGGTDPQSRLGSVGDLAFVLERAAAPDGVLVTGTDNIYRFSLTSFWRAFRRGKTSLVFALQENDPEKLRRSAVLELGPLNRVQKVHEKPAEPPSMWSCPATYALKATALPHIREYLDAGHAPDAMGSFIDYLAAREPVRGFKIARQRLHVGSLTALQEADEILRREPVILEPE